MAKAKKWDVTRIIRGKRYRVCVKALTNRDGLLQEQLRLKLTARLGGLESSGLDDVSTETLRIVQYWPLLRYGTEETEGLPIPETEDQFWAIPEVLMMEWYEAIVEVNPQYSVPFLELKKMLETALNQMPSSVSLDTSQPVEAVRNGSGAS